MFFLNSNASVIVAYLDDLPGLHGERGEVSTSVDGHALSEDGVQSLHLLPRQHTESPTLLRGITGGHGEVIA